MHEPTHDRPASDHGHDHQGLDGWAARGITESVGRESAENDVSDEVLSTPPAAGATTGWSTDVPGEGALPSVENPGNTTRTRRDRPVDDADGTDTDRGTAGSTTNQGDQAESAGFTGDGAYSEGQFAGESYSSVTDPVQD